MCRERIFVRCPNCAATIITRRPAKCRSRRYFVQGWLPGHPEKWFSTYTPGESEVSCDRCGWEFRIDSDGFTTDDGEAEPQAELELDDDGEVVVPVPDGEVFPPWHGLVSLHGRCGSRRAWHVPVVEERADDAELYDQLRPVEHAVCPNCRTELKRVWLGPVHCPMCDWEFSLTDEQSESDGNDEGEEDD